MKIEQICKIRLVLTSEYLVRQFWRIKNSTSRARNAFLRRHGRGYVADPHAAKLTWTDRQITDEFLESFEGQTVFQVAALKEDDLSRVRQESGLVRLSHLIAAYRAGHDVAIEIMETGCDHC